MPWQEGRGRRPGSKAALRRAAPGSVGARGDNAAMLTRHLEVPRTARYCLSAEPTEAVRDVWFVLHGYGELASDILDGFAAAAAPGRLFVAPEGLSRYYRRGGSGGVGASWMTREERASEIADHVGYLDRLYATVRVAVHPDARVSCLGFSQGAAAACRWALQGTQPLDAVVLWGGGVPPDLELSVARVRSMRFTFVVGTRDPYFEDERYIAEAEGFERLAALGGRTETLRFDGGHEIAPEPFPRLFDA